eukprot:1314843-Prymnesium_polylepis.1
MSAPCSSSGQASAAGRRPRQQRCAAGPRSNGPRDPLGPPCSAAASVPRRAGSPPGRLRSGGSSPPRSSGLRDARPTPAGRAWRLPPVA